MSQTRSRAPLDQRLIVPLELARAPRLSFSLNTIFKLYLGHLRDRAGAVSSHETRKLRAMSYLCQASAAVYV